MISVGIRVLGLSMSGAATMALGCTTVSEIPMLWETTTHTVFDKVVDPAKSKWTSNAGPPQTLLLCLLPYRPKVGKAPKADINCWYSKVADRGEMISRVRICTGEFGVRSTTKITGIETEDFFDLRLVTDMHDRDGKLLKQSVLLEAGRLLGKCPPDMKAHKNFEE
jgi:hypothetical protein